MPTLLALVIGASTLTAVTDWAGWHFEEKDSRELICQHDNLPSHALEHLVWTTIMLAIYSAYWLLTHLLKRWIDEGAPTPLI